MPYYVTVQHVEPTEWMRWEEWRNKLKVSIIGAYEIGYLDVQDENQSKAPRIIYIGEGWIDYRLATFDDPARHTGRTKFEQRKMNKEFLWVRLYPVPKTCPENLQKALAGLLERELIWEFCEKYGQMPELNDH